MSTTARRTYLKTLNWLGVESILSESVFGYPYRISIGDSFSENPFYNRIANVGEVVATAAWVRETQGAKIFDIGAHCGYISSQLAQLLREMKPQIYSFEPVAPTFSELVRTVQVLGLESIVHPISVALSDRANFVKLNYSKFNSMLAQIVPEGTLPNNRSGHHLYLSFTAMADDFVDQVGIPDVIKMDVEGWEVPVCKGFARTWDDPAFSDTGICFEWNPEALSETGFNVNDLAFYFDNYRIFYLNDYEGQLRSELEEVLKLTSLSHCCNLFAIKKGCSESRIWQWKQQYGDLKATYCVRVS